VSSPTLITESDQIKVLHIDDDKNQLEFLSLFLSSSDNLISVTSTTDPTAAIKYLETEHFDCVVTDFSMPQLNGIDLSKKIREISNIPIIIYTGQGSEEVAEAAFLVGIDDYLRKEMDPSHYQVLANRVKQIVEKRRYETLYQTVVEETRDAFSIIFEDRIRYANIAATELYGFSSANDLIGSNLSGYIEPRDRNQVILFMEQVLSKDDHQRFFEYTIQRQDGKKIIVDSSFSKINYNGKNGLLCFSRDITDKKKLELEKIESQERLRTLVEFAPDAIVTLNMKGYITSVNPTFLNITGFDEEEIVNKHFLKLKTLRNQDLRSMLKLFSGFLKGNEPPILQFQYNKKDKSIGWGEAHIKIIEILGKKEFLVIVREVSQKKKLEEIYGGSSKQNENYKDEKYYNMNYFGDVFSLVGEELLTPIVNIMNLINYAKSHQDEINYLIPNIENAVTQYIQMIDGLNRRFESPKITINEVNIKELINEVINDINIPSQIKVNLNCSEKINGYFDRKKIRQAIYNLISNSNEAIIESGEIIITVGTQNSHVIIQITDNGEGIEDSIKKSLFKPFITTKKQNSGLGLYYCKKVIEEHQGTINIHSERHKGTIITIILPQNTYNGDMMNLAPQMQTDVADNYSIN